ncbi:MAG: DoxX family membrane protein [Rhizomicrobium sp.]
MNGVWDTFEARLGRLMFAIAWVALGIESLVRGIPVMRLEAWDKSWPGYMAVGYISGAVVLLAGIGLMWAERAKLSASVLAILTFLWTVGLHLTRLVPTIFHSGYWEGFAECFAVFGAAWVLVSIMPPRLITNTWDRILDNGIPIGRICFGLALLVFGAMHFIYLDFTAGFIPAWFPHRELLAEFTGAAHIAAGLAILSGVLARLGATLAGIMYLSWVLVLHIPRVVTMPKDPFEWNGAFVATMLSGAAFIVAATFIKSAEGEPK